MSLLNHLLRRHVEPVRSIVPAETPLEKFLASGAPGLIRKKASGPNFHHRCGFEPLEAREMLSADGMTVTLATVYLEVGMESKGDMFSVCWVGDASVENSTRLDKITINLGSEGYFDTTADPPGVGDTGAGTNGYLPFTLVTNDAYGTGQVSTISLDDFNFYFDGDPNNKTGNGASSLTIEFNNGGLAQGEKLVFLADVDHREDPTDTTYFEDRDVISSGGYITAWFTSEHFIMSEATSDFSTNNSDARYYQKDYELPNGVDLLSNYGAELGADTGIEVTNEGNNTAAVVTDIVLDVKPKISGYVYADVVKDCYYKTTDGDYAISDVLVTLERDNGDGTFTAVSSMYTDENGFYEFDGLDSGDYRITSQGNIDYSPEYVYTDSCARSQNHNPSSDPLVLETTVSVGSDSINNNFGKILLGSIEGNVFEDRDDNGYYDHNDADGIDKSLITKPQKVLIGLYQWNSSTGEYEKYMRNGVHYTTYTDTDGAYKFDDLAYYEYYIDENGARQYVDQAKYAVLEMNQPTDYDDGQEQVGSTETGVNGTADAWRADSISDIVLRWDGKDDFDLHGEEYNFGELMLGSIAGNVYEDRNDNGIMEEGEPGIDHVKIELLRWNGSEYVPVLDADGNARYTYTDENGAYVFDDLEVYDKTDKTQYVDYAVREVQPLEYTDGKEHVGTLGGDGKSANDEISKVKVGWNQHGYEYDFGELKLGSVAGYVFEDHNDDGVYDKESAGGTDKPIAGVTVALYYKVGSEYVAVLDADGQARTDVTDANGFYKFDNLDIEKTYAIREVQPTDYTDGKEQLGTFSGIERGVKGNDEFSEIDVHWDEHGIEYNFGELKLGSIAGYVFVDNNDNGIYDDGDEPIPGVTVDLYYKNDAGNYVRYNVNGLPYTLKTDSEGYYKFDNLNINITYQVVETQPSEYDDGKDHIGSIDGITVGTNPVSDTLSEVVIGWDNHGVHYDFGEIIPTPDPPKPDPDPEPEGYNIGKVDPINLPARYYSGSPYLMSYIPSNVATAPVTVSKFGGGGGAAAYAWHLSVLNGGYPRSIDALGSVAGYRGLYGRSEYMQVAWSGAATDRGEWLIRGADGSIAQRYVFGADMAIPVVGDWDGDGADNLGLYVNGQWLLDRNGDGAWDDDDLWAEMGNVKDQPVVGDWDGDGKTDIGIFGPRWSGDTLAVSMEPGLPADRNPNTFLNVSRPKNVPPEYSETNTTVRVMKHRSAGDVRIDLIDHVFEYGQEGDKAVTGDWNGDGIDKIGVFRNGTWYIDVNGNGVYDDGDVTIEGFGNDKSIPIVGDWDGDGIDNIGLFEDGLWALDTNGDYKPDSHFTFGQAGDKPVSGDFNGDGTVEFGVYRASTGETTSGDDTLSL